MTQPLDSVPSTDDADQPPTNHIVTIETVISSLDTDGNAMVKHSDSGHIWKFHYGSVEVFVKLTGDTDTDLLTCWAPVLDLPAKDELQLMYHLLEKNWVETFEACFGIFQQQVVVLASRVLEDISPAEISRIITVVATIADYNDEDLQKKFGAT